MRSARKETGSGREREREREMEMEMNGVMVTISKDGQLLFVRLTYAAVRTTQREKY